VQNNIFLGLFVGHNTVTLKQVDSTNSFLKEALSKSTPLPEGTVIMADSQYSGRGQTHNTWHSEPGKNLTLSILLNPRFLDVQRQFDLNIAVSLAINDVLTRYFGYAALIKWPNDSYIADEKIGGMLIENIIQGSQIKHSIIGIGLNINQCEFPPILRKVTSFSKILHADYDLTLIKNEICGSVEAKYLQLKAGKIASMKQEYLKKLYLLNQWANFKNNGQIFAGKIVDVTSQGFLQMETEAGLQEFALQQIQFITN
jgi:BirA family transcriptional regulator, biotin operon repressor / biotin---[acetyl-CoA-carboxylase] ligase